MSMEDILKALVDSRQQESSTQGADQMTDLIGGLLGGGQQIWRRFGWRFSQFIRISLGWWTVTGTAAKYG